MEKTAFQVTTGKANNSAYRQFFGIDSRIPEMRRGWTDRLRKALGRGRAAAAREQARIADLLRPRVETLGRPAPAQRLEIVE